MICQHEPIEFNKDEISKGVSFFVRCKHCNIHLMLRRKGDQTKVKKIEVHLGEELNIPFKYSPDDLSTLKKYSGVLSIPYPLPDFNKETGYSSEKNMDILYEMLANDEIDIDQFNKFSTRLS